MAIAASKGNLMKTKRSRELASLGYDLMDRKRNILIRELMAMLEQAKELEERVASGFRDAYESMALARLDAIDIERAAERCGLDNSLSIKYRSVMGVEIPMIASTVGIPKSPPYSLGETTSRFDDAYMKFHRAKFLALELAETENTIYRLAYTIRKTQTRANALKNIVKPRLDATIRTIEDELEEKEREEFVRLKVVKREK